eukprot:Nk52_evm66s1992 gene=Nk52_evmTU66s1992
MATQSSRSPSGSPRRTRKAASGSSSKRTKSATRKGKEPTAAKDNPIKKGESSSKVPKGNKTKEGKREYERDYIPEIHLSQFYSRVTKTTFYGMISYVTAIVVFFYFVIFLRYSKQTDLMVDVKDVQAHNWKAMIIDFSLLNLFFFQHSGMASTGYKVWFAQKASTVFNTSVPYAIERSTYVLITSLMMVIITCFWIPIINMDLWDFESNNNIQRACLYCYFVGIASILMSCISLDNLELLGLKQTYYYSQGLEAPIHYLPEEKKDYYRHMRHPVLTGLVLILVCVPQMSLDRFFLSFTFITYMIAKSKLDSRDVKFSFRSIFSSSQQPSTEKE